MADKMTKKEMYALVREIVAGAETEAQDELLAFIDHEVEMIAAKAEKAAARAAEKRAASDELRSVVQSVLTSEYQTAEQITAQIDGEDVTKSKIVARLSALVRDGVVEKEQVKVDSRKIMGYRLVSAAE